MSFREYLKNNIVYLDGGMGTLLQAKGLTPGEFPERWNISHPDVITEIQKLYFDAGSNVVCTNTFGANSLKFDDNELESIIRSAIENAKRARDLSGSNKDKFIALDIGPTGKLLKPLGQLDFEDAVSVFAKTVEFGKKYGVDLVVIETMNDSYETKAALLAVKDNCDLPVIVTNAYGEDGKLMTGATPSSMVALLEGMGADAIGANCSLGPKQLAPIAEELLERCSVPVVIKPNAGLPVVKDGKTFYDVSFDEFSDCMKELVKKGVRVVGGCCGTTHEYIKALCEKTVGITPVKIEEKNFTVVSSYTHSVTFGDAPVLIGERINPTGKKRFRQALIENDIEYILNEGVRQQEKGVHILDVNVGIPDINETEMLTTSVKELQAVIDLPLQLDTSDVAALEAALRIYNGKAMINSVNGKKESMEAVFPLVKKYGGVVVALTLDENGIPDKSSDRVKIAERILDTAEKYGIDKKDIIFDTLAMTISTDTKAAVETLKALSIIKNNLGCHTSLGVSNVSFGLPFRDVINSVFFTLALENGLSAAIMNPFSDEMMKAYYAFNALKGFDEKCSEYIEASAGFALSSPANYDKSTVKEENISELKRSIIKGLKEKAGELTMELLTSQASLDIVNNEIIPALNIVGEKFDKKTLYLPQLLMSAEAAKSAFEVIKEVASGNEKSSAKGDIVIATVFGDIHDIGKNIVKLLLENYGFNVVDLGKNVPAEDIVNKVREIKAPLVGLSALMTTTTPAMEETIKQLRDHAPWCKIMVGGAVLTEEFAEKIGADKYARDAMESVRYAEVILSSNNS